MTLQIGEVFSWSKSFTEEETLQFAELSGEKGRHLMERDENGRFMVPGLFTASLGVKIGGELNVVIKEMVNEYIRPVYTGDTITCKLTVTNVEQRNGYQEVTFSAQNYNQQGKDVLLGSSQGIIWDK
ncbi:FAS1-like dehydratase domain-containing protein [Salsuginibacillus kocurii]|uniref:FAS1-like dehydratase domain-containing protein n=1 Tax=Salsuginibacillus kocurii TaxID=427078 RepID=UPI00035C5C46|nr:MaoC family dehydratase N-terminal domain-containing protein [Salsuginibacillus kocurii]